MELLQLRYFCALAEKQHLTNTANELLISPSSLSLTISKLEKELGVKLFDRIKRNIYLNKNGELFYTGVKRALEIIDNGVERMTEIRQKMECRLSIAITSPMIWNDFFMEYKMSFPDVNLLTQVITLEELNGGQFHYDYFMGNSWDLTGDDWNKLQIRDKEQTLVLVSKKHPLSNRKIVSMNELRNEVFITLGDVNPTTDYFLNTLCNGYGFSPCKVIHANYFTRMQLVKDNLGIVLITDLGMAHDFVDDGSVHKIKLKDEKYRRYQTIAWKKNRELSIAAKQFREVLTNYYASGKVASKGVIMNDNL